MKKNKRIIICATICLMVMVIYVKPHIENLHSQFMDFIAPNQQFAKQLKMRWENKSTSFLMKELCHPSITYSEVAASLLCLRRDPENGKVLEKIIVRSKNVKEKSLALRILFSWDAAKATEISMGILKSGRSNPLFNYALLHLGKRKYAPAFPYAVSLATASDRYTNGSIAYLQDFCFPEAIMVLENMAKDPEISRSSMRLVTRAIESIKAQNTPTNKSRE